MSILYSPCLSLEVILTIEGPRLLGLRSVFLDCLGISKMESCSFAQAHMAPLLRWGSWPPLRILVVLLNQHIDILRTGEFTLLQVQPRASRQASETDLGLCTCSYHVPRKTGMSRIPIQSENSMVTYITHQPHGWTRSLTLCYKSRLSLS